MTTRLIQTPRRGFTAVEMASVVTVIAILALLILPLFQRQTDEARITAAADVLDALIAERCYKDGWSYKDAIVQVSELAGTKLDPAVVEALKTCDQTGKLVDIFRPEAFVRPRRTEPVTDEAAA